MDLFLFTVEDFFVLSGIGPVLCPGISHKMRGVRGGQRILILKPNGEIARSMIQQIPMIRFGPILTPFPIALPKNTNKEDVPIGSQIWVEAADLTPEMIEYQNALPTP